MRTRCLAVLVAVLLPIAPLALRAEDGADGLAEAWRVLQSAHGADPGRENAARGRYWQAKKDFVSDVFGRAAQGAPVGEFAAPPPTAEEFREDLDILKRIVLAIFEAYEREDIGGLLALVDVAFTMRDRTGNDHPYQALARVALDDFQILEGIAFIGVVVGPPSMQADGEKVEIEVRWSRRAKVQVSFQEWIVEDQRTVFQFTRSLDRKAWLLWRLFGDPIFWLANRKGVIVPVNGLVDGSPIAAGTTFDRESGVVVPKEPGVAAAAAPAAAAAAGDVIVVGTFNSRGQFDFDTQVLNLSCLLVVAGSDLDFRCLGGAGQMARMPPALIENIDALFPAGLDSIDVLPSIAFDDINIVVDPGGGSVGLVFAGQTDQGRFYGAELISFVGEYTVRFKINMTPGKRNLK